MNHGHYQEEEYKNKLRAATDKRLGPVVEIERICKHPNCDNTFIIKGRIGTTRLKRRRKFCSRSCANSRASSARWNQAKKVATKNTCRRICFENHEIECCICGYDEILEVHHVDKNRDNNTAENLIPICPNHHIMFHRGNKEQKERVGLLIENYIDSWKEENGI